MKCILILIDDDGAKENMWEGRSEFQLGTDINIEFLKGFLWISYWKMKLQRRYLLHFKALGTIDLQYEIRLW